MAANPKSFPRNPHLAARPCDGDAGFLSQIIETQRDIAAVELDPKIIMRIAAERTQKLTGADGASVLLVDGEHLVCRSVTGVMAACPGARLSMASSLSGRAVQSSMALYCQESESDPRVDLDFCKQIGVRSLVSAPLFHAGEAIGVLNVVSLKPRAFERRHVDALQLMGGLVAAALQHAAEFEIKKKLLCERTKALAALRESEERFRSSFEHAAIGVALVALNGRWLQVNRSVCDIVGYSEAEMLVTDFQAVTHPDDLQADLDYVRQLIAGEIRDYHMTKRYLHKQGHIVWILLSVSLVRDESGEPLYFISQIQDITERKRIEDALRISEEAYRTSFEMTGVGMAHTNLLTGRFLRVNRKLCDITGYSADQLRCMTFYQITHPDDVQENREAVARMVAGTANEYIAEKRYIRKDGTMVWVSANATVIRDLNGVPLYAVAMTKDITGRKRAEEALGASEHRFRTLASCAPVGIFQRDAEGNNTFVNDRWSLMTGMSAAEAAGSGWAQALHPEDRERVTREWEMTAPAGKEFSCEYRYLAKDGRIIWVQGTAVPLHDETGQLTGYLGTSTDVTERKQAERLERDRREVLELIAEDRPLDDVLDRLIHLVKRQTGQDAAVMLLDEGDITLHAPSLPEDFCEILHDTRMRMAAGLSTDTAGEAVGITVSDIGSDPLWQELRPVALARGLKVCWALSLRSKEGTPLGLLTICCRHFHSPTEPEQRMLEMVGKLATIGIERHQTTRQLAHLVRHDPLTGLPNRILFEDRLEQALTIARRKGTLLAVFALDLDRFKTINDTLGHPAGDALLQQFSHRVRAMLRQTDTLARVGGDEFLLLLPELHSPDGAAKVANTIIMALAEPFTIEGREMLVTGSIGIALAPRDGLDSASLHRSADAAMYVAKRRGRNAFAWSERGAGDADAQ